MYYRTRQFVYTSNLIDQMLAGMLAAPEDPFLTTPKMILYTAGPPPTPGIDLTQYTVATFHGYAADTLTLTGPLNIGGSDRALVAEGMFTVTAGGTPLTDTCLGYLVTNGSTLCYGGEAFPAPVTLSGAGAFLQVDLILPLPTIVNPTVA